MFKKKKVEQIEAPHQHQWKDFDWYLECSRYKEGTQITIFEPYVCVYCKERKNIKLAVYWYPNVTSAKTIEHKIDMIKYEYPNRIKGRAEIEDEINDFQLVDRATLEILESLRPSIKPAIKLEI